MLKFSTFPVAVAAAMICCPMQAFAAPITYFFDSGPFTSSPNAQSPLFGTHFTAALTYSDDLIPGTLGADYLNRVSEIGNAPGPFVLYQHATLIDWTVTSGTFTLNASNATITSDLSSYTSASTSYIPLVTLTFQAIANDIVAGGSIPVSITAEAGLNITQGIGPYPGSTFSMRNFNHGGGTLTKATPVGGGGGTGTPGAVPEPATWAMMILGFGMVGATMRRGSRTIAFA